MSKSFIVGFAIAAIVIPLLVWQALIGNKGSHLAPITNITKVGIQKVDENAFVVVFNFTLNNDSDRKLVVRTIEASLDSPNGASANGRIIASKDLANVIANYPSLGGTADPPFKAWDEDKPRQRVSAMIGMSFEVTDAQMEKRKDIDLRLEDISGAIVDLKTK